MIALIQSSFDDYLKAGEETVRELHSKDVPLIQGLRAYHDFFARRLWVHEDDGMGPVAAVLSMQAFMLFLAGTRTAMTGHVAAIFPILRTALEAACYAYVIAKDRELESIWANRQHSQEARKACRRQFNSAVLDTAKRFNAIQKGSGDLVMQLYEAAIDFGAHPNARSILDYVSFNEDDIKGYRKIDLAGLYDATAWETSRALIACMEYGQTIAIVLVQCMANPTPELHAGLIELNEIKERLVAKLSVS